LLFYFYRTSLHIWRVLILRVGGSLMCEFVGRVRTLESLLVQIEISFAFVEPLWEDFFASMRILTNGFVGRVGTL
jgi:hypothetical protein